MNNFRDVNEDILKEWIEFREDELSSVTCEEDKNHRLYFDEIAEKILNNVPKQNRNYIKKQLDLIDRNFIDFLSYWNEKYYRNGFCDGVQIVCGCIGK